MKHIRQAVLIICGTISVFLGILGIFLPLLPTTPFLLLGAACYIRSSKKLYNWLITNKWLGRYIKAYYEEKGIPLKAKIISVSLLWLSILSTIILFVSHIYLRLLLFLIAIGVTWHILSMKTITHKKQEELSVEGE